MYTDNATQTLRSRQLQFYSAVAVILRTCFTFLSTVLVT